MVELARPSLRSAFAAATGAAYGLGGVLLALTARRLRAWRRLLLALHAPALLLPLARLLLDDSARWLHARGRGARAEAVIRKAARWNKVSAGRQTRAAGGSSRRHRRYSRSTPDHVFTALD